MKRLSFILFVVSCLHGPVLSQPYGWKNITANLPKFHRDTTIINDGADTIIARISGITFLDNNHGWICTSHPFDGDSSAVLETIDGGLTWTEHKVPLAGADIHMIDEQTGYFGAQNGFIYKTTDGAKTWILHGLLSAPLYDLGFPPRPAQTGYAGGKNGRMAILTPQGVSPLDLGLNGNVYCIDFPSEERGYALLDYQMIIFYQNEEWHVEASYPFSSKDWIYFLNDTLGWCVGEMFLKTTVGIDWFRTDPGYLQSGAMMGVHFTDENNGWAVGTQGQIAYSSDGGNDWTPLEHNLSDALLTGVLFTSPDHGYIIGGEKTILKYGSVSAISEAGRPAVQVYPNPVSDKLRIKNDEKRMIERVEILDLFGKTLFSGEYMSSQGEINLDVGDLARGIYMCRIYSGSSMEAIKVIRQ